MSNVGGLICFVLLTAYHLLLFSNFLSFLLLFYSPFRTYAGPVGGIRSTLSVDANHLRPYFYSELLCLNDTAWNHTHDLEVLKSTSVLQTLDFSSMESDLRGFSDALRVGRYAYFTPLNSAEHSYSYKVIRLSLGDTDIGTTLKNLYTAGGSIRQIIDVLDLSKINTKLSGYSGLFTSGQYLFFVPYRNSYEPSNGQRGHGVLTRLNMNDFSMTGIDFVDLPTATRNQIPSFADVDLRGFSYGFASKFIVWSCCYVAVCWCGIYVSVSCCHLCILIGFILFLNFIGWDFFLLVPFAGGQYGVLVPFYNAVFSGKVGI